MPTEWIDDRITDALQTYLGGISGANYFYPSPRVVQAVWFVGDELLDESVSGPIYAIRPGVTTIEESTSQFCNGRAEIFILAAQKFKAKDTPYVPASISLKRVQGRMARDIVRRLLDDVQASTWSLGGAVENVIADSLVIDRDQFYPGWALVEIRFEVKFHFGGLP